MLLLRGPIHSLPIKRKYGSLLAIEKHEKGLSWEALTKPLTRKTVEIITKEKKVNCLVVVVVGGYKISSTCLNRLPSPMGLKKTFKVVESRRISRRLICESNQGYG